MPDVCYVGNINFASYPAGGEVFLDGVDQGVQTPVVVTGIPIGEHVFTIRLQDYVDFSGRVTVLQAQTVYAPSALLIPAEGCIYFDSTPPGAKISLDGTFAHVVDTGFATPKMICNLPLGKHVFKLVLGAKEYAGSVDLKPDKGVIVKGIF